MTLGKGNMGLTSKILLGMISGFLFGTLLHNLPSIPLLEKIILDGFLTIGGKIFISTLEMLVVPLVFVSLICGAASLDNVAKVGRVGGKVLLGYTLTTMAAVSLALVISGIVSPGKGFNLSSRVEVSLEKAPSLVDVIVNIFPTNIVKAMAEGQMLQVIVFAILAGLALAVLGERGKRLQGFFEDLNEAIMTIVSLLVQLAPYGVFCLMAKVFALGGFEAILPMLKYFSLVLFTLLVHCLFTLGGMLKLLGRLNPVTFFKKMQPVMFFCFSTSSSNASLPVTLETVEHRLGVKNSIASFSIPLGATINMDGTAIMQGVATVFIAGAYNIDLAFNDYLLVILTATLASIGTAGVPGVGLITLAMVLKQVGLPEEGIGLIIGIDRLLDMARTVVNVTGDAAVSCLVAKSEGEFEEEIYNDPHADVPSM